MEKAVTNRRTLAFWLENERQRSPFLDDGEIRAIAEIKLMMVLAHEKEERPAE